MEMTETNNDYVVGQIAPDALTGEFGGAKLDDQRLSNRLVALGVALGMDPSASIPQALPNVADREAAYRFVNSDKTSPQLCLQPHYDMTVDRAARIGRVIIAHDTTSFGFSGTRSGLGPLLKDGGKQGFYAHMSLCIDASSHHEPLGILNSYTWVRKKPKGKRGRAETRDDPNKESLRWAKQLNIAAKRLEGEVGSAVHVMDREADAYEHFCQLVAQEHSFVARAAHDRVLADVSLDAPTLFEALNDVPLAVEREVELSPRKDKGRTPQQKRIFPSRRQRVARLQIGARRVALKRSSYLTAKFPASLELNVVLVREVDSPPDETPVEWILLTNEPINTVEEILAIVDAYRARWNIEEYFKALKTGCEFQKLQLDSYDALASMLAIYTPIAWQLLRLRSIARTMPDEPGERVLSSRQLDVLKHIGSKLPPNPTVRDVMLAIAHRGGHIPNNGAPGWLVIGRGLRDLLQIELGWAAAMHALGKRCDKS